MPEFEICDVLSVTRVVNELRQTKRIQWNLSTSSHIAKADAFLVPESSVHKAITSRVNSQAMTKVKR